MPQNLKDPMTSRPASCCSVWAFACALLLCAGCATHATRSELAPFPNLVKHAPRVRPFDVEHYSLELDLFPKDLRLEAECRVRFWSKAPALEQLNLDFVDLEPVSITDEEGRDLAFEQRGDQLSIQLEKPLPQGEPGTVCVRYRGSPRRGLWFTGFRAGTPTQVFTQGECQDARGWFPCFDEPSDRATSEIRVSMPAGWTSVAAGSRVDAGPAGAGRVFEHWRMQFPHPTYLVTLVAGEFETVESQAGGVPLTFLSEPRLAPALSTAFGETDEILEFLAERTGQAYPYEKYSQVCVEDFQFGGMENISATTMTDTMLRDEAGWRDWQTFELVAHEAAHQWFGNFVTCEDWSHIWLNEGFATYFAELYTEHSRGVDAFRANMRDRQEAYMSGDQGDQRRPTVWNRWREPMDLFFGGHTYAGGASRLHMLRFELGDAAFFGGIRAYLRAHAGGSVETGDLRRAMEQVSQRDLGWFFRQWFEQPGFPEIEVDWKWDQKSQGVRLSVRQTQAPERGTPAVFRAQVDVEVRSAAGAQLHRIELKQRQQDFFLACEQRPEWVRFDKYGWLVKRLTERKDPREWLRLAEQDDDVNGRRDALRALAALPSKSPNEELTLLAADVVAGRLSRDACAQVRVDAAKSLTQYLATSPRLAQAGLCAAAETDAASEVRTAALQGLTALGASPQLAIFARAVFEQAYSPNTMGAAAALVCSADPAQAADFLLEALDRPSAHGTLRAHILQLVGAIQTPECTTILCEFSQDENQSSAVREAATAQLGRAAHKPELVRKALLNALEARGLKVRLAAIQALEQRQEPGREVHFQRRYKRATESRERRRLEQALGRN